MAREFDDYLKAQRRFQERLDALRDEMQSLLDDLTPETPGSAADKVEAAFRDHEKLLEEHRERATSFAAYLRDLEKSRLRDTGPVMSEKRASAPRDQAEIERLSQELSLKLKLDRIDEAMKELLAFLSDEQFFATNATTGRRRRLRTLQKAIEKALG